MLATLVQNISEHFASMTLKYDIWEVKKVAVQVSDNKIDSATVSNSCTQCLTSELPLVLFLIWPLQDLLYNMLDITHFNMLTPMPDLRYHENCWSVQEGINSQLLLG